MTTDSSNLQMFILRSYTVAWIRNFNVRGGEWYKEPQTKKQGSLRGTAPPPTAKGGKFLCKLVSFNELLVFKNRTILFSIFFKLFVVQ